MKGILSYSLPPLMMLTMIGTTQAMLIAPPEDPDFYYSGQLITDDTGAIQWVEEGDGQYSPDTMRLFMPNQKRDNMIKLVWLHVKYLNATGAATILPIIEQMDGYGVTVINEYVEYGVSAPYVEINLVWKIWPQPPNEIINLTETLANSSQLMTLICYTKCVPEPTTLSLMGLGVLAFVRRKS